MEKVTSICKKKNLLCFIILSFFLLTRVSAQSYSLGGAIINKKGAPLEGATLVLYRMADSLAAGRQLADSTGHFLFTRLEKGQYMIAISMTGYLRQQSSPILLLKDTTIQAIVLEEDAIVLGTVTVTSQRPQLEQKSDRLIFNTDRLNTAGDNALDVLKKAPGVGLDKDGHLTFRNNGGVVVLLDGKRTYMSADELSNYLKNLPGETISKVELIANAPANYDAEGTAGLINIITKRNKWKGFNGSINGSGSYGRYGRESFGVNGNMNLGKVSAYVRGNQGYSDSYNALTLGRQIGTELYLQNNYWHPISKSYSYTAGMDYFINDKQTLGFLYRGYYNPQDAKVTAHSETLNSGGEQTGGVNMFKPQYTVSRSNAFNLNYSLQLDSAGQKLVFDADAVSGNSSNREQFFNTYFDAHGEQIGDTIFLRNNGTSQYNIKTIKADYSLPFASSWLLESGLKSSWVHTDNNVHFDSLKAAGWVTDPKRTDHFMYDENINAAYLTLSKTIGSKWELKAGLRTEQTRTNAHSEGSGAEPISRQYWIFVPSIFATYHINDQNQLNASYSGRINRPAYSKLNPFAFYSDPYTAIKGNPFLLASHSQSLLFSYTYKSFQVLSLSYLNEQNPVTSVLLQNDQTKESIREYENLGNTRSYMASSGGSGKLRKWWLVNGEINLSYDIVNSVVENSPYHAAMVSWSGSLDQTFLLPQNFKIQLSALYYSPSVLGLERTLSASQIDAGITKTLLDKKMTLAFKVQDIFFNGRYRSVLKYNNVNTTWQNEWDSRRFSLSVSYQFGNRKIKTARNRTTGAEAEQGRL